MTSILKKILHVEDESDIRAIAKMSLEKIGQLEVESCASGQDALDRVAAFAPDMVLLDAMMPEMDGPEVLKQLRARDDTNHIPIVFMTAKVQASEIEGYKVLGALEVISKPFDPMTLHQQLKDIWLANQS
ncbi:MAG: response regulator [Rhodospirillaceae bacterium]|nr:response regulator [Rhodospirillaceae bacterium]MBT6088172.1 response regulator [Rhodospirillaceae bacterium]MBT7451776.1 response regulator [Rhodospirillaceae bacterium]